MKQSKILALLLAAALAAGMGGCTRKSRRPALPAAPLQSSFTAEQAEIAEQKNTDGQQPVLGSAPAMKSAAENAEAQKSTEELLEAFTAPLDVSDALYQDYTTQRRKTYVQLRQRPEEVIALALPELLSDVGALECYTSDTSRTTLLYCLLKDTLQDEPFSWDGDSYRWLSDMVAEFVQFVSGHAFTDGMEWFEQNAPLTGLCAAVLRQNPTHRLNMTPCQPMQNAQALTNAKLVFAAALENRDAERFGFEPWQDGMANGFDFTTDWTLTQNEAGEVTLTAKDPDTGETASLCYVPNEAERESLLSGYGTVVWTKTDGETIRLPSQNSEREFLPAGSADRVQDYEMVLENGAEIGMDYNTVRALAGSEGLSWSDTGAGMGFESRGVMYVFCYDEALVMRLQYISFRFAEGNVTDVTSELSAARGISLGDTIQSVFDRLPAVDTTLKMWALQEIYGWSDPEGGTATLQFVADSFYSLNIITPGGRCLNIMFTRLDRTVDMMDIA